MKLNASKTKTMIVSRSCTMHHQSPPLTIGATVLKESDDLVILGVTFDSNLTFEKHLRLVSSAVYWSSSISRAVQSKLYFDYTEYVISPFSHLN